MWGYQVHNTLYPNGYVDVTDKITEKRELLEIYRSQIEFGQRFDHMAVGMAAWNARFLPNSTAKRYVEVFFTLPLHEYVTLVESFYLRDLRATYRGDSRVISAASAVHQAVMQDSPKGRMGLSPTRR